MKLIKNEQLEKNLVKLWVEVDKEAFDAAMTKSFKKNVKYFSIKKSNIFDGTDLGIYKVKNVNEKAFKGKHQLITADSNDVRFPVNVKPYVSKKDGKTKYPYVWVEKIISSEELKFEGKAEPKNYSFAVDEEDTPSVSSEGHDLTDENHPFK